MIISLSGNNTFRIHSELIALIDNFKAKYGEIVVERLDGSEVEFERIRDAVLGVSLFSSNKLVVLDSPVHQKQFSEHLDELLQLIPETTDVIIVEPNLDKRLTYFKQLKAKTDFRQFDELDLASLTNWALKYVADNEAELSRNDAQKLIERLGINQEHLKNELDKLMLYDPKISSVSIELLTEETPQSTVFDLLDAALRGDRKKTIVLYREQRILKVEPQQIIALIAWQLHVLAMIKTAAGLESDEISKKSKINPFVIRKSQSLAKNINLERLKNMVRDALNLDLKLKTENIDADEALQFYLLSLKT